MNWAQFLPVILAATGAGAAPGTVTADPLAAGAGGLFGALIGLGAAYAQQQLAKKTKKKK